MRASERVPYRTHERALHAAEKNSSMPAPRVSTHVDIDMCRRKSLTPSNPDAADRRQGASGAKVWTAARTWVTKRAADSNGAGGGRDR